MILFLIRLVVWKKKGARFLEEGVKEKGVKKRGIAKQSPLFSVIIFIIMGTIIFFAVIAFVIYSMNKTEERDNLKKELEIMKRQISNIQGGNSNSQFQNNSSNIPPNFQPNIPPSSGGADEILFPDTNGQNQNTQNQALQAQAYGNNFQVANQSMSENGVPLPPNNINQEQDFYADYFKPQTENQNFAEKSEDKNGFIEWIKDGFLLKLGSFFILISVGWFVSYAFIEKKWIGEIGVTTLGVLLGIAVLVWGTLRVLKYKKYGDVFVILGTAISILVITFAVHKFGLFGNGYFALLLMLLILSFSTFISVKFDLINIVRVNILFAGFLPFLAGIDISNESNQSFFMTYLLVILLGTLWVVWVTKWREFILYCLVMALLYSLAIAQIGTPVKLQFIASLMSFVTILVFFVTNIVGIVRQETEQKVTKFILPSLVALGTVFLIGIWTNAIFYKQDLKIGFIFFIWALVFAFGSFVVTKLTQNKKAFYLYGSLSISLLGIATAYILEGATLTLVLALEIFALVLAAAKITEQAKIPAFLSLLYVLPIMMSVDQYDRLGRLARDGGLSFFEKINSDFWSVTIVMLVVVLSAFSISALLKKNENVEDKNGDVEVLFKFLAITAGILAFGWYNLFLDLLTSKDLATFISIFTVVSLGLFLLNLNSEKKVYHIVGYVLLVYGILRLFFGTGSLDVLYKVLIFALIGVLFIVTELNKKKKTETETDVKIGG